MLLIDILDMAGTAAFAISGALVGIKNRLDLFGVFVLAIITASGGGLIRDVILGEHWPVFFRETKYFYAIVISTALVCLTLRYLGKLALLVTVFDAIGLGVFTILTAYKSIKFGMPLIGVVFLAVLTGIGGGIVRDIMVRNVPLVFKSEIYAVASITGALIFWALYDLISLNLNIYTSVFIIFAIRMVSMYFNMNLPVIRLKNGDTGIKQ